MQMHASKQQKKKSPKKLKIPYKTEHKIFKYASEWLSKLIKFNPNEKNRIEFFQQKN